MGAAQPPPPTAPLTPRAATGKAALGVHSGKLETTCLAEGQPPGRSTPSPVQRGPKLREGSRWRPCCELLRVHGCRTRPDPRPDMRCFTWLSDVVWNDIAQLDWGRLSTHEILPRASILVQHRSSWGRAGQGRGISSSSGSCPNAQPAASVASQAQARPSGAFNTAHGGAFLPTPARGIPRSRPPVVLAVEDHPNTRSSRGGREGGHPPTSYCRLSSNLGHSMASAKEA